MKTLIVIDDNSMMREFIRSYFSEQYNVETFENGEQALSYMQAHNNPDIILLDYELEGMNGMEILQTLKSSGFFKSIPVILLSGKDKSETRISCLQSGAQDYLTKPFNPVELALRIQNATN